MTVKEYLHQAYRLDQRIKSDTMEAQNLREMAGSVSAIQYDKDRVQTSRNTEAPFVRTLEKLWTLEKKIAGELEMLSDLKKQIREVIEAVPDTDERMVLKYRYIHNYTWEQIGMELCADARTIRRWLWLKERGCERLVNKRLLESYSEAFARYIQCSEAVSKYGMLGKHPTTGAAIASPFTQLLMNFQKQANLLWYEIYDIVKQNCTEPFEGSPQDSVMEQLLRSRRNM